MLNRFDRSHYRAYNVGRLNMHVDGHERLFNRHGLSFEVMQGELDEEDVSQGMCKYVKDIFRTEKKEAPGYSGALVFYRALGKRP